jgi:hypothetical protein
MNLKKLLKIFGFVIGPLLPLAVAIYFLYPYLNEKEYQDIAKKYENTQVLEDSSKVELDMSSYENKTKTSEEKVKAFRNVISHLRDQVDSLNTLNDSLKTELLAKEKEIKDLQQREVNTAEARAEETANEELSDEDAGITEEEFADNIKSLLSLDDENLSPIINEMNDQQLIRLYKAGNSLQRKKLLRTLKSKRAANLMTEVMR